uniref:R13L1/DRL21-like LRR repeat region domain-containing protein n=1 Tax=Oryza meridionalis TaxID=40149 RepID=A0A0E0E3D9_9ORYZ
MVKTINSPIQLKGQDPQEFWELFKASVFGDEKSANDHDILLETGKMISKNRKGSPLAAKTVGRLLKNHLDLEHWTSVLEKGGSSYYVMHGLLHELALKVSSYECLTICSSNVKSIQILPSIRHLSIVVDDMDVNDGVTFENIKKDFITLSKRLDVGKLHSLMLFGQYHGSFIIPFSNLLRKARALRIVLLSMPSYAIVSMLHNFSKLVHLRYLRINGGKFSELSLPNIISRFYHLRILDVRQCKGHFGLPRDMNNLVKLRHFLVQDDKLHTDIANVGKLKCLQELRRFEVKRQVKAFALNQIGQLDELKGSLGIYDLENAKAAEETKLLNKSHLHKLILDWNVNRSTKDNSQEEHILENLRPHSNLREVHIQGHGGTTCPSWLGPNLSIKENSQSEQGLQIEGKDSPLDSTFWKLLALSNLTELRELKMKKCPPLPLEHLKLLSALRRLSITDSCIALLPTDCENTVTYHFLVEQLEIYECNASGMEMTQLLSYFPELMNLRIEKCQKITGLGVAGQEMMATLASPPSLSYNKSEDAQIGKDQQQPRGDNGIAAVVTGLPLLPRQLQNLDIKHCSKLILQFDSFPSGLQQLYTDDIAGVFIEPTCRLLSSSLTKLSLSMNHKVERFTKEQNMALQLLSSLEVPIFVQCSKLQSLPAGLHRLTSLKRLEIAYCPNIRSLPKGGFPSSLEVLHVYESQSEELKRQCRKLKGTIAIIEDEDYLEPGDYMYQCMDTGC